MPKHSVAYRQCLKYPQKYASYSKCLKILGISWNVRQRPGNIVIWPKSSGYSRYLGITWNAKLRIGTFCNGVESRASSRPLPVSSSIATTACYARAVRVHGWRMKTAHWALDKRSVSSPCWRSHFVRPHSICNTGASSGEPRNYQRYRVLRWGAHAYWWEVGATDW